MGVHATEQSAPMIMILVGWLMICSKRPRVATVPSHCDEEESVFKKMQYDFHPCKYYNKTPVIDNEAIATIDKRINDPRQNVFVQFNAYSILTIGLAFCYECIFLATSSRSFRLRPLTCASVIFAFTE